jgi:anthranilate phosphoribosyltransferase
LRESIRLGADSIDVTREFAVSDVFAWPAVLGPLLRREDLSEEEAGAAMGSVLAGEATPAQIAAFATGLRIKGETATEMTGLVKAMLAAAAPLEVPGPLLDTCGTGGDRAGTFNVSTLAALVAVGAGQRVAKHGNRAASGRCGSADLLEALGVAIALPPEGVAATIEEVNIGFCFAPVFHPAFRHAAVPRRELGVPTVFNFLGPLTNPARAAHQALGVADPRMAPIMAEVLRRTGIHHALVFYGHDGYRQLWRYWLDAFEDIRWDPEEILDFGDKFLVTTQQRGRGSGSGVAVSEPVFQLFTVRRGLVVRQEDFLDRSKALEAAGLRE